MALDGALDLLMPGVLEEGLGMGGHAVTLRELLNHTGGIPDVFPGRQPTPGRRSHFRYSKVNYTLAGMIVESLTGSTRLSRSALGSVAPPD